MVGFGFLSFLPTYKHLDTQPYEFSNRQAAGNFNFIFRCVHILSLLNFQFSKFSIFQNLRFCQTFTLTNLKLYNFSNCQFFKLPILRIFELANFQFFGLSGFHFSTLQTSNFSHFQLYKYLLPFSTQSLIKGLKDRRRRY